MTHAPPIRLSLLLAPMLLFGCTRTAEVRESEPPAAAQRIISTAPGFTEILFAVGAGDQVVAVTDFCAYPPEAVAALPTIGAYLNPDMERMLGLRPDLVVLLPAQEGLRQRMEAAGVRTLTAPNESHTELLASILAIGAAAGRDDEARQLHDDLVAELDSVRDAVQGRDPVPTLVVIGRGSGDLAGILAVGSGTFLDELLRAAGGRNVMEEARGLYPQVPLEEVIHLAPQVIVDVAVPPSNLEPERIIGSWSHLTSVPAVRDGRVHVLAQDYLLIPGPRAIQTARLLQPILHPGLAVEAP